ncbi:phosphatidylinositol 3-kinase 2 isoform X2 [Drosophila subpulchrella]|uniref:phosphatidylinositol 3-kinase 2 isoform X2 n=2 Tax=Drosophila subpulchrella TaxID=1486046 RepID=UPI0018A16D6A|nr:phosphatidylinositol 3-kinase 2 isoform X2 [Drosophila subpulchrella]
MRTPQLAVKEKKKGKHARITRRLRGPSRQLVVVTRRKSRRIAPTAAGTGSSIVGRSFKTSCKRLKMEKTPRYTQRERNMVLSYAAQYKDVIENKRTDAESNRKKDEVWLQIADEFNSRVYHQRSAKQLRQLYKNMKLLLKKDLCGEDKDNRSFMDLLNTLARQESVAQYIAEQLSPEGAGGGKPCLTGSGGGGGGQGNGHHADDYEDSKMPLYPEGMDTDVILIKSETISDNEQTDNGMDCLEDDDDDDSLSPKAPEVCLEEEDDVLFPTDLRQLVGSSSGGGGGGGGISTASLPGNVSSNGLTDNVRRAASSPVCSTKTSVSSGGGSYASAAPKPDITIQTVGHIRVGSFANINKTLQNGGSNPSAILSSASNGGSNASGVLPLTAEQVQQHTLLNGLGLSAVNPSQSLQAAINAPYVSATPVSSLAVSSRRTPPTLHLPRLQRANNNNNNNNNSSSSTAGHTNINNNHTTVTANGVQLLLNGNHHGQQTHHHLGRDKTGGVAIGAAGSFNGYNGMAVAASSNACSTLNSSVSGSGTGSSANSSGVGLTNASGASPSGAARSQHQELMNSLRIEESRQKIALINAQIEYWQTLTRKLNSQPGHMPNPACPCHFPGASVLSPAAVAAASASSSAPAAATASASVNLLQTQASTS